MFRKVLFITILTLLFSVGMNAAVKHMGFGRVFDSYSRELLMDVQIDVLSPRDSTLIKTTYSQGGINFSGSPYNIFIDTIPDGGAIFYLRKEGFYPAYANLPKIGAAEDFIEMQPILMNRIPFYKPKELNEVIVTASKVKMVVKGDTITYNADAFSLAQGSMLDGLIDQLPGAQLKSDGKIYINGKFVNELLVNGDNFFKGDPRIALENLPAYMVNDIQVYHRNDLLLKDTPIEELPLVMNVKLKKQYQTGWIANAEAGYGTSGRYLGRMFAMMFNRSSRLSVVGNVNNTNDDRKPGQTDNWNPDWQSAGRATIASGGIDYLWNSRMRVWKVEADLMARHKKSDITSDGISERYLPNGSMLGRQQNSQSGKEWRVTTDDKISFHVPRLWLYLMPTARFEREKATATTASSTSDSYGSMLNSIDETVGTYRRLWNVGGELNGRWQLPASPNSLTFGAGAKWSDRRLETTTARSLFFTSQPEKNELSRPQEFMPERKMEASAKVGYRFKYIRRGTISLSYAYMHQRVHSTRDYFLTQESDFTLPSVRDAVYAAGFVASNSYDYTLTDDRHTVNVGVVQNFTVAKKYSSNINASVGINYAPGSISYVQADNDYRACRSKWFAEPSISYNVDDVGNLSYKYTAMLPQLRDLLDVTDAANPLFIFTGNSGLKTTRIHEIWLNLWKLFRKGPRLDVTYRKYDNLIAQSASYDMTTGITTYKPVNVNGNWDITGNLRYHGNMDTGKKWWIESTTRVFYQNSVDLIALELSTVRNLNFSENLKLTYNIMSGMEISANGKAEWRKATSPMVGFDPISAVDFDYGIIFRATKLPWNMSFTTDLMMHSRRGYTDSRLNSNDLVWNARLAKSILNGNLTFALDGFDILGNLSNVRLAMNSQGRTETHCNTLPRYAMLHVIYRLNRQPKK